jgi:hypothetical protein
MPNLENILREKRKLEAELTSKVQGFLYEHGSDIKEMCIYDDIDTKKTIDGKKLHSVKFEITIGI